MPVQGNPIALLAVLDVALYRFEDDRFRRLADDTVEMLLDHHLGLPMKCDVYRLFEVLADFEMDRLGLVCGAGRCPGFWRRMCAWMQAGLIVRTAVSCRAVPEVGQLEKWCKRHTVPAGSLRRLADVQAEPLVLGHMRAAGSLRHEVLVRLGHLKERHEKAGRVLPKAAEFESLQSRMDRDRLGLALAAPGPAAMHLTPCEPIPDSVADTLAKAWTLERPAEALALTAHLSQRFVLRDSQLEKVGEALESIKEHEGDDDFCSVADQLNAASIVAAAARETSLADSIGAAVNRLASRMTRPDDVDLVIHVLFQAAAGHTQESEWGKWLATQLAEVAERMPTEAGKCKPWLWYLLDSMAMVLPIRSWVHLPAKQIAGVAMEAAP